MREIELTQGKVALVDDVDYELLSAFKWCAWQSPRGYWYAGRMVGKRPERKFVFMHREILKPSKGRIVDHIDGDGLHNCRSNLREVTVLQNIMNSGPRGGTSKFKGVRFASGKWRADIRINGKKVYLGRFDSEQEAASAYDQAAFAHFGEDAWLNSVQCIGVGT